MKTNTQRALDIVDTLLQAVVWFLGLALVIVTIYQTIYNDQPLDTLSLVYGTTLIILSEVWGIRKVLNKLEKSHDN